MRWIVTSISVLKPVVFQAIRRNEVQTKLSPSAVKRWMSKPETYEPLAAGAGAGTDATPRNSLVLRDVSYVIEAFPRVFSSTGDNTPQKYAAMLMRRVEKGQCYQRPCMGCREFPVMFEPLSGHESPIHWTEDLGRMLYDVVFRPDGNRAVFFPARVVDGVLDTSPELVLSDEATREEVLACSYKR
jgi:CRISPR-associated protein Cas5d